MKRVLLGAFVASFAASTVFANEPAHKEESWTGKIIKKSATEVEFEAGGKKYDVTGAIEKDLIKDEGKEMQISGIMNEKKDSIQVSKAEPVSVHK